MLKSVLKSGQEGYVRCGKLLKKLAGTTGLEPATSCVTGMRSNQLNYVPLQANQQIEERSILRRKSSTLCGSAGGPMGGIRFERMTFPV